jgi:hypothetical protein
MWQHGGAVARYPLRTSRTWPPAHRLAEWHVSDGRNVHAIPFLRLRWKLDQTPSKLSGPLARTSKVDRAWSETARLQVHSVPVLLNATGQLIRRRAIGPQPEQHESRLRASGERAMEASPCELPPCEFVADRSLHGRSLACRIDQPGKCPRGGAGQIVTGSAGVVVPG